jgi:enoyl-CoA hydratase/carnithine racemase
MSQPSKVKFAIQGAIARITLDRPEKLNALDPEMLAALENAVSEAEQSREVRVIILAAAGEKAFCVGADILAWTALSPLDMWSEVGPPGPSGLRAVRAREAPGHLRDPRLRLWGRS